MTNTDSVATTEMTIAIIWTLALELLIHVWILSCLKVVSRRWVGVTPVAWDSDEVVLLGRAPARCVASAVGCADSEPEGCGAVPTSGMTLSGAEPTGVEIRCGARPTDIETLCGAEPTGIETWRGAEPTGIETLCGAQPTGIDARCGAKPTETFGEAKLTGALGI